MTIFNFQLEYSAHLFSTQLLVYWGLHLHLIIAFYLSHLLYVSFLSLSYCLLLDWVFLLLLLSLSQLASSSFCGHLRNYNMVPDSLQCSMVIMSQVVLKPEDTLPPMRPMSVCICHWPLPTPSCTSSFSHPSVRRTPFTCYWEASPDGVSQALFVSTYNYVTFIPEQ